MPPHPNLCLLEASPVIHYPQEVLGHNRIKTPPVYPHVTRQHRPVSPLESAWMLEKKTL
jgi:hypothetical protein